MESRLRLRLETHEPFSAAPAHALCSLRLPATGPARRFGARHEPRPAGGTLPSVRLLRDWADGNLARFFADGRRRMRLRWRSGAASTLHEGIQLRCGHGVVEVRVAAQEVLRPCR